MYSLENVTALAPQTDLFIHQFRGSLDFRENYLVARTPDNPGFFWGNFLFFPNAPRRGTLAEWQAKFRKEFTNPEVKHLAFAWNEQSQGDNAEFLAAGFQAETGSVLSLQNGGILRPEKAAKELTVRPLDSDRDWEAATLNQIACRLDGWKLDAYIPFKRTQMAQYRRMQQAGHGHWWGAFQGTELVAECGLFFSGSVGRFQNVGTVPAQRRRGFCSGMVHAICAQAFTNRPELTLVIVAEEGEPADRIYRSVGFAPAGKQFTLTWWPREHWNSPATV